MPTLKNHRHEAFAQALVAGQTADQAYQTAGYKPNRGNATTLKAKQSVKERVAELLEKAAAKTLVTVDNLTLELEAARLKAMQEAKGASAAVSSVMGKAKLHGLLTDKTQLDLTDPAVQLVQALSGRAIRPKP